jgi:DNA-binding NarL/FixJ family response regulator
LAPSASKSLAALASSRALRARTALACRARADTSGESQVPASSRSRVDEYVYDALRAGASGFVLKDDPPEQLIGAVRTVAAGDALLSPAITKRVIKQFTRIARPAPPKELGELTAREHDILQLIADGLSNAEIGRQLHISETTVKTHVTHILQKLGLRDRVQAVVLAYQTGLTHR